MVLFPEMRAQFLSLQRVFASGLGATHPPQRCHTPTVCSPPGSSGTSTPTASFPMTRGCSPSRWVQPRVPSLPWLMPPGTVLVYVGGGHWLQAGARAGCRCRRTGVLAPPGQQPETWCLLALPGTPALRASGAVCFFCISCLQRLALQDASASQPPLQHRAAWQGCFPRRPHGCHRPTLGGTDIPYILPLSPAPAWPRRPDPRDVCPCDVRPGCWFGLASPFRHHFMVSPGTQLSAAALSCPLKRASLGSIPVCRTRQTSARSSSCSAALPGTLG